MKQFLPVLCMLLLSSFLKAQAPNKMSYQLVVRNSSNAIVANQPVGIKIYILKGSSSGNAVFVETHTPNTNINGLASFVIGDGTLESGNISTINWGEGSYYIKTEVDPGGGTNYSISSTSQLLSVPYALFAGSSPNQGKTYLVLEGDITNTEAAAIIAANAGPQTQFVYIRNTTNLTSVDLGNISNLLELSVSGNSSLVSLNAPFLKSVSSLFSIKSNNSLTAINLPVLENLGVGGFDQFVEQNNQLKRLIMPALFSFKGTFWITSNAKLDSVAFAQLQTCGLFYFNSNPILNNLTLPILISGSLTTYQSQFTNISAPLLTTGSLLLNINPLLTTISFPQLNNSNVRLISNPMLNSISFPELRIASINLQSNITLNNAAFPKLFNASSISISANSALSLFTCPLLATTQSINISSSPIISLDLNQLQTIENLTINDPSLTSIGFQSLESCGILDITNGNVQNISFPNLTQAKSLKIGGIATLLSISAPLLKGVSEFINFKGNSINSISLAQLDTIAILSIQNTNITSFTAPQLRVIKQTVSISQNPNMVSISLPVLNRLGAEITGGDIAFSTNKFPSSVVNNLLSILVNVAPPLINKNIYLYQAPAAPPTGQGIIDKATLISRPNLVSTN